MAKRRMFSQDVIQSARFIKMPSETQALYFHLALSADDDGIVEAFNIMRLVGATEDSLKLLVAKGFIVILNDDLVTYITDWTEHNKIRADRKIDSIYKDLLLKIVPDAELIKPKQRADRPVSTQDSEHGTSQCQPKVGIGKDRLGEVRLGEGSNTHVVKDEKNDFDLFWKAYPKKRHKENARKAFLKQSKHLPLINDLIAVIEQFKHSKQWIKEDGQYIPHPSTWINAHGWDDEMDTGTPQVVLPMGTSIWDMIDEEY